MIDMFRFVKGYVRIGIFGELPERFLNLCAKKGISVWQIERSLESISVCVGVSDYLNMRELRKSIGYDMRVKLLEKRGLPFFRRKVIKRLGFSVGIAVFLIINIIMSQFIWKIDVNGNEAIKADEIINTCEDLGIAVGMHRKSIDTYDTAQKLALRFDNIAWVSLNIEGSKLTVNISEATIADEVDSLPRNIIASFDGVVKRLEVTKGTKNVEVDQAVQKGDLLVSGVVDNGEITHFVRADGLVMAKTHRSFTETVDKSLITQIPKGKLETRKVFEFFGFKVPLYLQGVNKENRTFFTRKSLRMFGGELPIAISTRTFIIAEEREVKLTSEQAADIAIANVSEKIRTLPIDSVLSYSVSVKETESSFVVKVETVCDENICEYQKINSEFNG